VVVEIESSVTFDDTPMTDDAMRLIYHSMNGYTLCDLELRRPVRTVHMIASCDGDV
jgi:hypothetical protein